MNKPKGSLDLILPRLPILVDNSHEKHNHERNEVIKPCPRHGPSSSNPKLGELLLDADIRAERMRL
jgi:hypothetical protein